MNWASTLESGSFDIVDGCIRLDWEEKKIKNELKQRDRRSIWGGEKNDVRRSKFHGAARQKLSRS
jgi:hypothetical protein